MATSDIIKARVPHEDKELFMKKCLLNGTTASDRIRWLIQHDIQSKDTIEDESVNLINEMFERKGFVRDELLITRSNGSIEYEKLRQYCVDHNIPITIDYESQPMGDKFTTGYSPGRMF